MSLNSAISADAVNRSWHHWPGISKGVGSSDTGQICGQGLTPPTGEWSFVALVIDPNKAVFYLYNTNGQATAMNAIPHISDSLDGQTEVSGDQEVPDWRLFDGLIDEIAIFNYALSPAQVQNLYHRGSTITLRIDHAGANVVLIWPRGTLLEATNIE